METKNVQQALNEFGQSVIDRARLNLKTGGRYGTHNASGQLSKSLDYKAKESKNSIAFDFYAEDYWAQLDYGTKGSESSAKAPNSPYKAAASRSAIDKWVIRKGIQGVRGAGGQFANRKMMVTSITNSINRTGTYETRFFRNAFDIEYKDFDNNIVEKYGLDLESFLEFSLKEI